MESTKSKLKSLDSQAEKIQGFLDDINEAYKYALPAIDYFKAHKKFIEQKTLSGEDEKVLDAQEMPKLTFPILKPIKSQQLKNVRDSSPESVVKSLPNVNFPDGIEPENRADWYTQKLEAIYKRNHLSMRTYAVADNAFSGGYGIYKVKVDYISNMSFGMSQYIESVDDPTRIIFDPSAKHPTKKDAEYVIELDFVVEPTFKRLYPSVDLDELEQDFSGLKSTDIKWITKESDNRYKTITVATIYHKEYENKTLYSVTRPAEAVQNGQQAEPIEMAVFENPKENPTISINDQEIPITPITDENGNMVTREVSVCTISRIRLVGKNIVENEKPLNFTELPFIFVPGELITINGTSQPRAFLENAIDAQRAKNFMASYFLDATLNAKPATLCISGQSMTTETMEKMQDSLEQNFINWDEYGEENNETVKYTAPFYIQPEPINPAYLAFFESLDDTINKIIGAYQPSLDQSNMSGKALYNMSAYINASIEPFMFNLMLGVEQLGKVVLSSFKFIHSTETATGTSPKTKQPYNYSEDYQTDAEQFGLYISPGINFKLQQQATIEWLIDLANSSPGFAQFLYTAGMPFLLENSDLNGKEKLLQVYEQYVQEQQQQPPQPSPQMIMAQAATTKANAAQMSSQADMMDAQTKQQQVVSDLHLGVLDNATELSRQQTEAQKAELTTSAKNYDVSSQNKRHLVNHLNPNPNPNPNQ